MGDFKLSICITTFNRAGFIGETLDSIISQATDEVEIVIVDGGSSDNTEEIVRGYQRQFPHLLYIKQEKNMGLDRDFNRAVELAQGEYCWLMADDDILKPGAIKTVLKETGANYPLIIVNAEVRTADLSKIVENKILKINKNRIYKASEGDKLFGETCSYLSFIGGVVIKREIWNQREKEKYFGTLFIHVGVIFQSPLPGDTLVISEPWIAIRYGNAFWTARGFEVWMFKWPRLVWSFPDYADAAKNRVYPREPWRRVRLLMLYRAKGAFSLQEYHQWLEAQLDSGWRKFAAQAVARTPGYLMNFLYILFLSIFPRKAGAGVTLIDLRNSRYYYRHGLKKIFAH